MSDLTNGPIPSRHHDHPMMLPIGHPACIELTKQGDVYWTSPSAQVAGWCFRGTIAASEKGRLDARLRAQVAWLVAVEDRRGSDWCEIVEPECGMANPQKMKGRM